jgi:RNA polymerase sigma factor (sigma-70 family)
MRWTDRSDADLLAATRSDADAFAVFYDRYEAVVLGFMLRRTGNVEVAVDLTSEVFAAALAAAHRYRPRQEAAAAWLFTIARNLVIDSARCGRVEARARRRVGIRDAVEYSDHELDRIETLAGQSDWASQLLAALPQDQRDAIRAAGDRRTVIPRDRTRAAHLRTCRPQAHQPRTGDPARPPGGSNMTLLPEYRDQLQHAAERRARRPRLGLRWSARLQRGSGLLRSVPAVLSVLVVVAVAVGAIIALGGGHPTPSSRAPSPTSSSLPWLTRLSDRFSVLRDPPTRPPAAVSRTFGSALDRSDLSFARRVTLAMGTVWIVPTPSQLCVALVPPGQQEPLGSSCSGIARAEKVGVHLVPSLPR